MYVSMRSTMRKQLFRILLLWRTFTTVSSFIPLKSSDVKAPRSSGGPILQQQGPTQEGAGLRINPVYTGLATAETIFWYWLAPGIDPDSRWFAPIDGVLISKLLDPSIVLLRPGYAFPSLLLNCYLLLPMVWAILLLQEKEDQIISPLPFCIAGFAFGGGALIPYMIVRKSPMDVDRAKFSTLLNFFEPPSVGPKLLGSLTAVVLVAFFAELYQSTLEIEWHAFVDLLFHSQFISLALFDFTMLSCAIVDPMMDDAKRRGYLDNDTSGILQILPFLVPLVGPVAWIMMRPKLEY